MALRTLFARLLTTTALMGIATTSGALAQIVGGPSTALGGSDAAEDDTVLFEADTVYREDTDSPIIAEGNVRAYFGKRYLKADRLVYDQTTDVVTAEGNVSITDESLETAFVGRAVLSGDLRDGVVENFSALLAENARLAADSGVREQGSRTRLRNAVYTACDVCEDDGDNKTPTWRVRALRVTRDEERKVVRFRHAFFEIKGIPVLYTPFAQGPDPSVERQSGFLTPLIGASRRLGFNFELPYYFAISNSTDATLFPKYTSNDGILWQGEVRRRNANGYHVASGGIIDFDNSVPDDPSSLSTAELNERLNSPNVRWNVFAKGFQDVTDNLRLGYDIERVSDDTFLRRYDVRRRGDLRNEIETSDTLRLRSNISADWQLGETHIRADSFIFQDLRTITLCDLPDGTRRSVNSTSCAAFNGSFPGTVEAPEIGQLTPFILPQINVSRTVDKLWGGRLELNGNFASLQRTAGADTRRLTASAYWEREHITRGGHRLKAFAELRGDLYHFDDLDQGTEVVAPIDDDSRFRGRFAPTVGAEWSYPLTKRFDGGRLFVEPRVLLAASLADQNDLDIINEDSQSIEFDYLSLFQYNKSTGFDAFEDGQRLNAGVAASAIFDNGIRFESEIGQQFRLQTTDAFTPQSPIAPQFPAGLGEERSDIVGSLNVSYKNVIGIENRFRIDDDNGSVQRLESRAFTSLGPFRGNASYVRLNEENSVANLTQREELRASARLRLSDHWSTGVAIRNDLLNNQPISQDFVLAYQDECALFEVTYRRDRTRDAGLETNDVVLFRFTLKSLVD